MDKQHKSMRIPVELVKQVEQLAAKQGRSWSNMAQRMLEDGIKTAKKQKEAA